MQCVPIVYIANTRGTTFIMDACNYSFQHRMNVCRVSPSSQLMLYIWNAIFPDTFQVATNRMNEPTNKPIYSCLKIKCLQQFSRIVVSTSPELSIVVVVIALSSWLIAFPFGCCFFLLLSSSKS